MSKGSEQKDYSNIKIKDTIITEEMRPLVKKEDYKYYYISEDVKVPKVAHYLEPDEEIKFCMHGTPQQERLIFPVDENYSDYEEEQYQKLWEYMEQNSIELPDVMTEQDIRRFLQGNHYKIKNTVSNIQAHLEFRRQTLPVILNDNMKTLIDKGLFYMHGRDRWFRPILISKARVLTEATPELEDALKAWYFVWFYVIEHCMLQGKVENWINVTDLDNIAINKLPAKFIINFITSTQAHLKCRGKKFFVFNVTFAVRMIYKLVAPFIDSKIKQKLNLWKDPTHQELLDMVHPSQLEEKYGGEAPNVTECWPPICPSDEYGHDPDLINEPSSVDSESAEVSRNDSQESLEGDNPSEISAEEIVIEPKEEEVQHTPRIQAAIRPVTKADNKKGCGCTIF